MDFRTKLHDSYEAGEARGFAKGWSENGSETPAAVAQAFAAGT